MEVTATVPLTIEPEAAALVAELGLQAVLERMLEHLRQTMTGLRRLNVTFEPPYDTGPDPSVAIEAYRDPAAYQPDDPYWHQFTLWRVATFSPEEHQHIAFLPLDEINHGR